ncbi:hypothetical protein [Marivita sp.]|uniref:hypothetical protein n=1 Tax=Marivita sp. TaxID=2003365 RepID=UPI003F70B691
MNDTISACENVCRDFSWLVPFLSVFEKLAIICGFLAAIYQLNAWRREKTAIRKSEIAEETLVCIFRLERSVALALSEARQFKKNNDGSMKVEIEALIGSCAKDFDFLDLCRARCSAIMRDTRVDDALTKLSKFRATIFKDEGLSEFVAERRFNPPRRLPKSSTAMQSALFLGSSPYQGMVDQLSRQLSGMLGTGLFGVPSDPLERFISAAEETKPLLSPHMRMETQ